MKHLGRIWGGSWEDLGRVLGGFGKGFGRVLEVLGAFWTLQGLFSIVSGFCWALLGFPGLFLLFLAFLSLSQPFLASCAFLVFAGLCWALTRVIIAGGERSERAKRASEALWCFLWVSLAYPCFRWRTLAFSGFLLLRFFACCLAFSLNGTLAFPHSFSILFLAAPCLLLFSLVLPCANIS